MYAVGVVLLMMISQFRTPMERLDAIALIQSMGPVVEVDDLCLPEKACSNQDIASLARRLLAYDPSKRPSAQEALTEALRIASSPPFSDSEPPGRLRSECVDEWSRLGGADTAASE